MVSWVKDLILGNEYNPQAIKNTEKYLGLISSRLSGREDCKGIEYQVTITGDNIDMVPEIYVFPKGCSRTSKLWKAHTYIANFKFDLTTHELSGHLVPGVYRYILSTTRKKRRWIRDEN